MIPMNKIDQLLYTFDVENLNKKIDAPIDDILNKYSYSV